jgi:hypothetical protein
MVAMALTLRRDERGAVYVEFLLAFLPLFFIFLTLCQVALLVAGKLVVSHAAFTGARSAIVVLDDHPALYRDAPRGMLSDTKAAKPADTKAAKPADETVVLARALGALGGTPAAAPSQGSEPDPRAQQGVRMQAIRSAALRPLVAIAPSSQAFFGGRNSTIADSLQRDERAAGAFARVYVEAAAVVTVHSGPGKSELASEPILNNEPVTLRVTYLQLCGIPVVRSLICSSLTSLLEAPDVEKTLGGLAGESKTSLGKRFERAGMPGWLASAAGAGSRFMAFEAEVTLPNQGARYEYTEP